MTKHHAVLCGLTHVCTKIVTSIWLWYMYHVQDASLETSARGHSTTYLLKDVSRAYLSALLMQRQLQMYKRAMCNTIHKSCLCCYRDLSTIDDKSLEELRCVLNKEPYQYTLYKPCNFQALAALLVNCKRQSDSTFLLRFEPCHGLSSSGGTQHYTIASLMREWAARKALEPGHASKTRRETR